MPSRVFVLVSEQLPRTFQEMIYCFSEGCLHQSSLFLSEPVPPMKKLSQFVICGEPVSQKEETGYNFSHTGNNAMFSHLSRICSPGLEMGTEAQVALDDPGLDPNTVRGYL